MQSICEENDNAHDSNSSEYYYNNCFCGHNVKDRQDQARGYSGQEVTKQNQITLFSIIRYFHHLNCKHHKPFHVPYLGFRGAMYIFR